MDTFLPRWSPSQTVAIVASGPSLRGADLGALANTPTIAINDSWRLVPRAEILYACDPPWWRAHDFVPAFSGERWTQHKGPESWPTEAQLAGLRVIRSAARPGVSTDPALIHTGFNSGFQALNLAILGGARRILLLGYDMQKAPGWSHWFGDHPGALNRHSPYDLFISAFCEAAGQIRDLGVEVLNCNPDSALPCFPRTTLAEALC